MIWEGSGKDEPGPWRWWFALIPVEVGRAANGGYTWAWLEWYQYRRGTECWLRDRRLPGRPHITFDISWAGLD